MTEAAIAEGESSSFVCSRVCGCDPSVCRNRPYKRGIQFPLEVRRTPVIEWELATRVAIPAGSFVLEYAGEVVSFAEGKARADRCAREGRINYSLDLVDVAGEEDEGSWGYPSVDASRFGNAARFIANSHRPNLRSHSIWRLSLPPEERDAYMDSPFVRSPYSHGDVKKKGRPKKKEGSGEVGKQSKTDKEEQKGKEQQVQIGEDGKQKKDEEMEEEEDGDEEEDKRAEEEEEEVWDEDGDSEDEQDQVVTMGFFATRDIAAGEALRWDYGNLYATKDHTMVCACGEDNCPGVIGMPPLSPEEVERKKAERK